MLEAYERHVAALAPDLRNRECALIELGRESARRFDDGHDPSGNRVLRVLTDLRKLSERWERLLQPAPPPPVEPERSQLDELRQRRAARQPDTAN